MDLLCWNGFDVYDCTTEFRLYFLRTKVQEETEGIGSVSNSNHYSIIPLLYYEADCPGIQLAYSGAVPFIRDGLLFMNKQGYYNMGLSPLVLVWKDPSICRYLLSTDRQKATQRVQQGEGRGGEGDFHLCTMDEVVLHQMSKKETEDLGVREGDLVRVTIDQATYIQTVRKNTFPSFRTFSIPAECYCANSWYKYLCASILPPRLFCTI